MIRFIIFFGFMACCSAKVLAQADASKSNAPSSLVSLSKLGEDAAAGKVVMLDNAFWDSIKSGPVTDYVKWDTGERNRAYGALMYLVAAWDSGSGSVSEDQLLAVFTAALDWGMLSDYIAVNGAVTRFINRREEGSLKSLEWDLFFQRMSDVVPFFVNEWVAAGAPKEVISELKFKFIKLFMSDSYEAFSVNLRKLDAEMEELAKTNAGALFELYIASPDMKKIAMPVYRNRNIWKEVWQARQAEEVNRAEPTKAR